MNKNHNDQRNQESAKGQQVDPARQAKQDNLRNQESSFSDRREDQNDQDERYTRKPDEVDLPGKDRRKTTPEADQNSDSVSDYTRGGSSYQEGNAEHHFPDDGETGSYDQQQRENRQRRDDVRDEAGRYQTQADRDRASRDNDSNTDAPYARGSRNESNREYNQGADSYKDSTAAYDSDPASRDHFSDQIDFQGRRKNDQDFNDETPSPSNRSNEEQERDFRQNENNRNRTNPYDSKRASERDSNERTRSNLGQNADDDQDR